MVLPSARRQKADQPLGHAEDQSRRDQIRIDAHVDQARDDASGVVGVQSREDQVAGQGGLDRQLGGLFVADLTDHDDVRVLAEGGAQAGAEVVADLRSHLRLADSVDLIFDRIFEREDVVALAIDFVQQRIEGGGLFRNRSDR
jgi:hypothetical protein